MELEILVQGYLGSKRLPLPRPRPRMECFGKGTSPWAGGINPARFIQGVKNGQVQ